MGYRLVVKHLPVVSEELAGEFLVAALDAVAKTLEVKPGLVLVELLRHERFFFGLPLMEVELRVPADMPAGDVETHRGNIGFGLEPWAEQHPELVAPEGSRRLVLSIVREFDYQRETAASA
jgi:hypothetical protein